MKAGIASFSLSLQRISKKKDMKELINKSIQVYNTVESHKLPSDFLGRYHIHVLCHAGKAQFSFMGEYLYDGSGRLGYLADVFADY